MNSQIRPEITPEKPANCRARSHPTAEISQGNVTVPTAEPRLPEPFMNPPSTPGPRRVMSMMVDQNAGEGTNCSPAATENTTPHKALFSIMGATMHSTPETVMETRGTMRRPHGAPHFLTA